MKINVLSLFWGIECWLVSMKRIGFPVGEYYSSEVDPYAIKITTANHPEVVHVGDIKAVKYRLWELQWDGGSAETKIDLLIGWSPCQDLSIAKAWGKGLKGDKSGLFFEYMRILTEIRPKYFLLENVASMKKEDRDEITRIIGVEPIMINSALVSGQNRKRLFWTNIPGVKQPEDKGIKLVDILEDIPMDDPRWKPVPEKYLTDKFQEKLKMREKSLAITSTYAHWCPRDYFEKSNRQLIVWQFRRGSTLRIHTDQEKSPTLTWNMGTGGNNVPVVLGAFQKPRGKNEWGLAYDGEKSPTMTGSFEDNTKVLAVQDYIYLYRKFTCIECERLQTLDDNYTACVSDSRRYKAIGNWWTVDIIVWFFLCIVSEYFW